MAKKETERVLTEKEAARKENMDRLTEELANQGYVRKDQTIKIALANALSLVVGLPFILPLVFWFFSVNSGKGFKPSIVGYICALIVCIVLIVVHEGIHGIFFGLCSPNKFKNIEFGFIATNLTPYCTCGDPLKKGQYILALFMPCLLIGIVPCIAAVFIGSYYLLFIGVLMILGAGGDLMVGLKILFYKSSGKDTIIIDHPTECGFIVFER